MAIENQQYHQEKNKLIKQNGRLIKKFDTLTVSVDEIKDVLSPSYWTMLQEAIAPACRIARWSIAAAIVVYARTHPDSILRTYQLEL